MNKSLKKNILSHTILYCIIYTVILFLITIVSYFICRTKTWYNTETLYLLLVTIENNLLIILLFCLFIGYLLIIVYQFSKVLNYFDIITHSYELVNLDNDDQIKLDNSLLKEYETTINLLKVNIRNSKKIAKEAEQRKNDLIVYLAHDLKTPLTSIIGYMTLLKEEKNISRELEEHYIDVVLNKSLRLEELINEFFEITRFNLTHQTLEYSLVNLTRLMEQLVYEFKPMFKNKNLTCSLNVEKDLMISCDVNKMQRVLDNLLRNAVNYSYENSDISIDIIKTDSLYITFTNKGNTIPEEKLNRIFEQFYRLDTSRTTSTGGSGLGLAIAKEIVELHQGTLTAQSENNTIIFKIVMPS